MSNVFGSCVDKHATWEEGTDANGNPQVTFTSNVEGQAPVSLCLNPVKGATLNGEPVEVIDGVLQLPTDMFGEGVISADGNTYTLTLPGQDPVDICLNPVKGATLNGEAVTVEDGILVLEDLFGEGSVSADGSTYTITLPGQTPVDICLDPVKTVNGVEPDADGAVELPSSTTVAEPEGFHTITTDDGVATEVCLDPVKTVTTVDANGDVIDGPNTPDADGNANAVGSTATPSADGTQHNILTSDGAVTPVCLNPAKSTVQDPATGVITTTYADGTTDTSDTKYSTTVPAPAGFHTITTDDGVATAVCLTPLKSINGVTGDINGNVNVADLFSNTVDNGDNTYTTTNSDGTDVTWSGDTFASQMDNGDGTVTFTMADGSTVTLCLNPVKTVVQNADGLGATVTYADGTTGQLAYPTSTAVSDGVTTTTTHPDGTTHTSCDDPVKDVLDSEGASVVDENGVATLPEVPPAATSSFTSNGDGTTTHDDGNGNVTTNIQEDIVDGGSNLVTADGVTINPLLDCNDAPIDVTTETFVANSEPGLYRQIFLPNCPADCTPPVRTKTNIAELACDPTGKTWKAEVGEATWTPVKSGFCRLPIVTDLAIAPSFNVLNATTNDVLVTKDIDFPNPTCDPVTYVVDIGAHMEGYINNAENGGASFFGIWINFDGFSVIHHTPGQGNTTLDYHDVSGQFFHRPELTVEVPPKTTVTKTLEILARIEGGYEGNVANTATALSSFAGLRAVGTTDCDLG